MCNFSRDKFEKENAAREPPQDKEEKKRGRFFI